MDGDRTNTKRRRLPMVKIEKDYVFEGPAGKQNLKALFEGSRQLIVYHFMFDPKSDKGCSGYTKLGRCLGRSVAASETQHDVRGGFSGSVGQARRL